MGRSIDMERSGSARRMNCKGVRGEPLVEGEDLMERGLCPLGVIREKVGTNGRDGSGVRGAAGGVVSSFPSMRVAELIHFGSRLPIRGGDSGKSLKLSAK